jgi:dCMP deaminase
MSANTESEHVIAAHIPVLHKGYLDLLQTYPSAEVGVFDHSITSQFDYLRKDIRALQPEQTVELLQGIGRKAYLLGDQALRMLLIQSDRHLVMPHDDISEKLLTDTQADTSRITLQSVFLRWDRANTATNVTITPDATITTDDSSAEIIQLLSHEANKSSDWWRHVSAALVKNDTVIASAHNHALPSPYSHYIDSDPRITEKRGSNIEASLFIHAESSLIADMAKRGEALEGTSLYSSTFPCPNCAKLIASSGITTCYFIEGYAMVDGYSVLKNAGVEVIKIDTPFDSTDQQSVLLPYPTS